MPELVAQGVIACEPVYHDILSQRHRLAAGERVRAEVQDAMSGKIEPFRAGLVRLPLVMLLDDDSRDILRDLPRPQKGVGRFL